MTRDKFMYRNRLIQRQIERITRLGAQFPWLEHQTPGDAERTAALRELLAAQERFLTAAERALDAQGQPA